MLLNMPPGIWCESTPVSMIESLVSSRNSRYFGEIVSKYSPSFSS